MKAVVEFNMCIFGYQRNLKGNVKTIQFDNEAPKPKNSGPHIYRLQSCTPLLVWTPEDQIGFYLFGFSSSSPGFSCSASSINFSLSSLARVFCCSSFCNAESNSLLCNRIGSFPMLLFT